jgi:hypothetical protein
MLAVLKDVGRRLVEVIGKSKVAGVVLGRWESSRRNIVDLA